MRNENLSAREIEVMQLIAQGLTNKEISERLKITISTVKSHLYSIYSKYQLFSTSASDYSVMRLKAVLKFLSIPTSNDVVKNER
jgi:DNA-binding CsgD family transcriptional regulator